MSEKALSDEVYSRLTHLTEEGQQLFDKLKFDDALAKFEEAWSVLPIPREEWSAALWVLAAIGDCHFYMNDYTKAAIALQSAIFCPGGLGSSFLHLRLGQAEFELGNKDRAADELIRAYALGGEEIFLDQDPKYLTFLGARADLKSHRS